MTRSHFSDIESLIDDVVTAFRNRGHTREQAVGQAALALGVTPRRVKSVQYGEPYILTPDETAKIRRQFAAFIDDQMAYHEAEKAKLRARIQQMRMEGI